MSAAGARPVGLVYKRGADGLRDDTRHYNYGGRCYPSVTAVLGQMSDFLWVHRNAITRLVDELAEKCDTGEMHERWMPIEDEGVTVWEKVECDPRECLRDGAYIANEGLRYLKRAADRGSAIHDLLADYAEGLRLEPEECGEYIAENIRAHHRKCEPDEVAPYAASLVRWLEIHRPIVWFSEMPVFNDQHGYAGTCDLVLWLGDQPYLVDLKTSCSFRRSWAAQVAAYAYADFGVVDRTHRLEVEMPRLNGQPLRGGVLMVEPHRAGLRTFDVRPYFEGLFIPALVAWKANAAMPLPERNEWHKWEVPDGLSES